MCGSIRRGRSEITLQSICTVLFVHSRTKTSLPGAVSWQMLWTGGDPEGRGSTCPNPLVARATCASSLRAFCQADAVPQRRTMMYAFGPGSCSASGHKNPVVPVDLHEDLANFLLIRGPYAWFGFGWRGCGHALPYDRALLDADYGEPTGLCAETAPGSGVFRRDWTKSTVEMDCNTWSASIQMKP